MKGWREVAFTEAVAINPAVKLAKDKTYPFVDMQSIEIGQKFVNSRVDRNFNGGGARFINGDVLMARITPCLENGKIAQYKNVQVQEANGSTEFIVFRGLENISDTNFIYYLVTSPDFRKFAIGQVTGTSGRQRVPTNCFNQFTFLLPPLPEQKKIADVLGALDDKIALNRQTCKTLEAMAQALFKSWFVDFEPVKAKMRGEQPFGMDCSTAALFPDALVESELGLIPKGWCTCRIDKFIELAYGKALKASDRNAGNVPVYGSGGITGHHDHFLVNGPSIVVGRKGTVGTLYWEDQNFFPIDTVFFVKASVPLTYCYYLLQTLGLEDMNTDAAVPGLNRSNVYRLITTYANELILKAFDNLVKPIRDRIFRNTQQIQALENIRDYLLPKLVSEEVKTI